MLVDHHHSVLCKMINHPGLYSELCEQVLKERANHSQHLHSGNFREFRQYLMLSYYSSTSPCCVYQIRHASLLLINLIYKVEVANFEQLLIPNTAFPEPRNETWGNSNLAFLSTNTGHNSCRRIKLRSFCVG